MAASKLSLVNLDFDSIKQNLIDFLSSQTQFSDYNFTGSALNVLMDTLSYNTHYLGYYLQVVANEMFLDSADLRENVVSLAKQLGYTPGSRVASTAVINFTIIPPNNSNPPATLVVPKNTKFTTSVSNVNYNFVTDQDYTVDLNINNNTYTLNSINIREGLPFTFRFTVDTSIPNQKFVIPNSNVDTGTIQVRVQNSDIDTTISVFNLADDINTIDGTTPVYFLQEVADQQYEVYFGDGIIGQAVQNGNIVIIDYLSCNADAPNFASIFTASSPIGGFGNIQVTTANVSFGGAERESIESVRFNAPKNYQAQDRAVTVDDYITILTRDFPNVDSLSIWGGEDNVPPVYGKVFISLKPKSGFTITETTKQFIIDTILQSRNVLTVIPDIIDPDFIFLNIDTLLKYNPSLTTLSSNLIQSLVITTINNFASQNISKFDKSFKYSNLVTQIDNTENSIQSNVTKIRMQKRIVPALNQTQSVFLDFNSNNPIVPGSISSSRYVSNALGFKFVPGDVHGLRDDGLGNIQIFKQDGTNIVVVKANAGIVNYTLGRISITALNPQLIVDPVDYIKIYCVPQSPDVVPVRNGIIVVDPVDVVVSAITVNS